MRELFTRRLAPYYIHAPDYRRSSSGIRVMHMLCDLLQRSGQEAYVSSRVVCPDLVTPRLTQDIVEQHHSQGITPIVVYPEITDGNPLNGNIVVRYILNQPGFVEGNGVFGHDDLLFSYTKGLLQSGMNEKRVLFFPVPDLRVFCPPADPAKRISGKVCYYQGRRGQAKIDPALLPENAVEITAHWPESWEALADLFQQCEIFYCAEASSLAGEAALCGCLGIVTPNEWAPRRIASYESKEYGVAWGTDPEEIERAKRTIPLLRELFLEHQKNFWPALDHFIEVTQQAAVTYQAQAGKRQMLAWLAERNLSEAQQRLIEERLTANPVPQFAVLVVDREGNSEALQRTLDSLGRARNGYAALRIMLLSNAAPAQLPADERLRVLPLDAAQPLAAIEQALAGSGADWFMLVEAGSEFTANGLLITGLDLLGAEGIRAVYGDELMRQKDGNLGPILRPDLNLDLLLSFPGGMARHWLFNCQVWRDMGGFQASAGAAFELDYILRLIESQGLDGLGHVSEPLLIADAVPLADSPDERGAILRHLQARGFAEARIASRLPGRYDIDYAATESAGVSILILAQGGLARVQRCMETVLEKTAHPLYEILLVDQASDDVALQQWLAGVERLGESRIRVLRNLQGSLAQVRNHAAELARGDYLLWLDTGIAVLEPQWLQQLLNHAARPEVAAVGAKLVSGSRKIAHAGYILGLGDSVAPAFVGQSLDAAGYMQRLQVDQDYSALSDKCLMLKKNLFMEVGGFDERPEMARWADIDLCLRLHAAGYLNVWTARVQLLLNEESATAPPSVEEEDALYERWLPKLARDPAYNPNLSLLAGEGFALATNQQTWRPLSSWQPVPTILAHAADRHGCGHYRIIQPFEALQRAGMADGFIGRTLLSIPELERYRPDAIILQRQMTDTQLAHMKRMKAFSSAFKVYEVDDYLPNLPLKSVHRPHMPKDVLRSMRRALACVDRFVVSTEPLAEAFAGMHQDIRVVRNTLNPLGWRDLEARRQRGRKPRVGWAGGGGHTGDLEMIVDVVKALAGEVEWVFFGMCPDKLQPYVHEIHQGVPIEQYPAKLASLDLDLALAPLEANLFNECKSNLRLLEYGACGFPVICSDLRCYDDDLPVTRVRNRFKDWVDAIRMHLADLEATAKIGDELRAAVLRDWMLEGDTLAQWRQAWLPS